MARVHHMVEVRRIELRSKAIPWQVSPSSVTTKDSGTSRVVTHNRYPSSFGLGLRHTRYVRRSIPLK